MRILLLDTNIVSYLMNRHTFAELYRHHLEGSAVAISFMTVAELYEGALWANWGQRRQQNLRSFLQGFTVFPSSDDVCREFATVRFARRAQTISSEDAWIAATALAYSVPLVTHNAVDFADIPKLDLITEPAH